MNGIYHRWSDRRRWWFELFVQAALVTVLALGVFECVGPTPSLKCPSTVAMNPNLDQPPLPAPQ